MDMSLNKPYHLGGQSRMFSGTELLLLDAKGAANRAPAMPFSHLAALAQVYAWYVKGKRRVAELSDEAAGSVNALLKPATPMLRASPRA